MVKKRKGYAKWIRKIESISDPKVTSVLREEWKVLPSSFKPQFFKNFLDRVEGKLEEGEVLPSGVMIKTAFTWVSHPAGLRYFSRMEAQLTPVTQEFIELCEFWREELG